MSVALHLAAALLVVYVPSVLPSEPNQKEQGTVELLMVEQKGVKPSQAAKTEETRPSDSQPAPPQPKQTVTAPELEPQKPVAASQPIPPTPPAENTDVAVPPPKIEMPPREARTDLKPEATQPAPQPPSPPKAQDAPVFDLAGTESESNAEVLGSRVIPASPDNRFRNRPPVYPYEAEMRGEHGSVLLVIHVSAAGFATGVDVLESSGVTSLDQAATVAVRKWRFRPALQEGRAVPFDMQFRFVFEAD